MTSCGEMNRTLSNALCDGEHHGMPGGVECNSKDVAIGAYHRAKEKGISYDEALIEEVNSGGHNFCGICPLQRLVKGQN